VLGHVRFVLYVVAGSARVVLVLRAQHRRHRRERRDLRPWAPMCRRYGVARDISQVLVAIGSTSIGLLVGGIDWRAHLGGLSLVAAIFSFRRTSGCARADRRRDPRGVGAGVSSPCATPRSRRSSLPGTAIRGS
jgi:hypothetical protein